MDDKNRARGGDRLAMAEVVLAARNQAMYSSEFVDWYIQPACLNDVIKVQLDFIASLAAKINPLHLGLST